MNDAPYAPRRKPNSPSSKPPTPPEYAEVRRSTPKSAGTPPPPASAAASAPEYVPAFDRAWWEGLGLAWAPGHSQRRPDPRAVMMANGARMKYRRATEGFSAAEKLAYLENLWKTWYPGLGRCESRGQFHALWLSIEWSTGEAYDLTRKDVA